MPWLAAALVSMVLLLLQPYTGIRHDSVLYLGQALLHTGSHSLEQDLFFLYGSQAKFTIFPQLAGWVLTHFRASDFLLAGTFAGRIFFLVSSWALISQLVPKKYRFSALVAILIMPAGYSRENLFAYGELFFTGRTLAEPLILFALAAMLKERWAWMAVLGLLAALIHPLQALPALILIWLWMVKKDSRWLYASALLLCVFLAFPVEGLLAKYDQQWWSAVKSANAQVVLTRWPIESVFQLFSEFFLVGLTWRRARGALRSFAGMMLVGALMAFGASALLVDVLHLIWPAGLQLWRVQWLLHWAAMAFLPWLLYSHYEAGRKEWPRLILLVLVALLETPVMGVTSSLYGVASMLALLYLLWPWLDDRLSLSARRLLCSAVTLAAAALYLGFTVETYRFRCDGTLCSEFDRTLLLHPLVLAGLTVTGFQCWWRAAIWGRFGLLAVLLFACSYASANWDQRTDWTRSIEAAEPVHADAPSPFGVVLEKNAQVLWPDELLASWLVLQRPNYLTSHQQAGLLFNRGTFEEARARAALMQFSDAGGMPCSLIQTRGWSVGASCSFDEQVMKHLCQGAQGRLNYIVLSNRLPIPSLGKWTIPAKQGAISKKKTTSPIHCIGAAISSPIAPKNPNFKWKVVSEMASISSPAQAVPTAELKNLTTSDLVRYFLASLLALIVDLSVFSFLLRFLSWSWFWAGVTGFMAGACMAYMASIGWVFKSRILKRQPLVEFSIFVFVGILGLGVTCLILWIGVEWIGLPGEVVKVVAAGCTFAFNFAVRKSLLFSKAPRSLRAIGGVQA